jgi:16S rRNA (cytidine1402-2'-O)-methyltransferase
MNQKAKNNADSNFSAQPPGTLYVVATPIGNLADISLRARETLAAVSKIAAEDTRKTRQLLSHIGVDTACFSLHEHNEKQKIDYIVQLLTSGESIALVSDAGTPLISDPGYPLVRALRDRQLPIVSIPGPCALISALSISGLPSDRFIFEGFLPSKSQARINCLSQYRDETATLIFYESKHRILASLQDFISVFGESRRVVLARELTKTYETVLDGELVDVLSLLNTDLDQRKGEFVVLLHGATRKKMAISDESKKLATLLSESLPIKQAAKIAAEMYGDKKNQIYQFLLESNS